MLRQTHLPVCQEDAEDAADDAEATAEEEDAGGEWPEELVLRGCVRWPELNGTFARTQGSVNC